MKSFIFVNLLDEKIILLGYSLSFNNKEIPLHISSACEKSPIIFSLKIFLISLVVFF